MKLQFPAAPYLITFWNTQQMPKYDSCSFGYLELNLMPREVARNVAKAAQHVLTLGIKANNSQLTLGESRQDVSCTSVSVFDA